MYSLIFALALAAQPTSSARTTEINVGAVRLRVPLPVGYCLPEGDQVAVAQLLAAVDTDNVTLLTLNDCESMRADGNYLIIKTPISVLNAEISRAELIGEMTTPEAAQGMEEGASDSDRETNERYAELGAEDASIATDIKMRGNDDVCVYLGGIGTETVGGKVIPKAIAGCLTAVGGRMVSLYGYREGGDPEGYRKLMPQLKHWALQIEQAQ